MRTIVLVSTLLVISLCVNSIPVPASAQQSGPFGLGIIVGEPTGINGKFYLNRDNAIQGSLAWSLEGANDIQIQGEYLFHRYDWINVQTGEMPVYFGIGGMVSFRENRDDIVGVQFPVGLDYIFEGAPFDIFGQIVPILEVSPSTDFQLDGALGARFFF